MNYNDLNFSFEIFPPKSDEKIDNIHEIISDLKNLDPKFISVTFHSNNNKDVAKDTIKIASLVKNEFNLNSLPHLTCVGNTKENIYKILSDLKEKNINKILALRGDKDENYKGSDFSYATELVKFIKENFDFEIYSACYPEGHIECENFDKDIYHLKEKIDAGTNNLITQLFFDNDIYYRFYERLLKENVDIPMYINIMPVTSIRTILKMQLMCGATIPRKLLKILNKYQFDEEAVRKAGIMYSIKQIEDLGKHGVSNIHISTMNNSSIAKSIILQEV